MCVGVGAISAVGVVGEGDQRGGGGIPGGRRSCSGRGGWRHAPPAPRRGSSRISGGRRGVEYV